MLRTGGATLLALAMACAWPSAAAAYVVKRTDDGAKVRWRVDRVSVELHRSVAEAFGPDDARRAVGVATDAWAGLGGPSLRPAEGWHDGAHRLGEPGVQVHRPARWEHGPRLLAVTVTSYERGTGRILDADVLVNPAHRFEVMDEQRPSPEAFDLAAVLTHEMGHVLGLGESDADPLATMWPRIGEGDTHQRTVEADDEAGVAEAYRDAVLAPPGGCGGAHVAMRAPAPVLGWVVMALVLGALGWLAWRRHNEAGWRRRGQRGRPSPAPAAGVFFAGALLFLGWPGGDASDEAPVSVRVARALSATERPAPERAARLDAAARDEAPTVRRAALAAVLASPRRDDVAVVDALVDDADPEVAELARQALDRAGRAPPAAVVDRDVTEVLGPIVARGPARVLGARRGDDGLVRTRVEVDGRTLVVPGGCDRSRCQQVGETAVPVEGEALVVGADGGWARVGDGLAWGGWLGHSDAVRLR
ncbi:MAG TPA: matrixin family metalloprotease [Sandaracinaceae bacterium LLY-WYZ-13_1]|nr:matrixin family metalloprotease [Sandaracinaceae bacterium LLY-WYZ-13_1]